MTRGLLKARTALGNRTEHAQWWDVPGLGCGQ